MRHLKMIRGKRPKKLPDPIIAGSTSWIRAEVDGIVRAQVSLGEHVTKGQVLAYISSPLGDSELELLAPKGGIVIGQQTMPLVNEGDAVFHLAYFANDNSLVEQQLENFIDEINDLDEELKTAELNN